MVERSQVVHGTAVEAAGPHSWRRYCAVGDSLSEGLGDPLAGGGTRGWAALLAGYLRVRQPDLTFVNLAVRGHLTRDAVRHQLEPALAASPDLVSVFIGGNDVLLRPTFDPVRFANELAPLVIPFVHRRATVVLSTLPDLAACGPLLPPFRNALRRRITAANDVIRDLAAQHHTVLLDAWADPRTRRHAMWSIDRIHPSAEGHRLIAASVARLLGVPVPPDAWQPDPGSLLATGARHAREVAWLLRYARRAAPTPSTDA